MPPRLTKKVRFDLRRNVILKCSKQNVRQKKTVKKRTSVLRRNRKRKKQVAKEPLARAVKRHATALKRMRSQQLWLLLQQWKLLGKRRNVLLFKKNPSKYRKRILRLLYANIYSLITDKHVVTRIVDDTYANAISFDSLQ